MQRLFSSSTSRAALVAVLLLSLLVAPGQLLAQDSASGGEEAAEESTFFGLGLVISQQLASLRLSDAELEDVIKGVREGLSGKHEIDPRELMPKIQAVAAERAKMVADEEREASKAFAAQKAEEAKTKGGEVTESGLIYTELVAGSGESPGATDKVTVHYHGTLRTGEVFDSSVDRGQPATFGLNQVIPCWTEGVQKMKVGGKAQLICPADIAYGDRQSGKIPPGATLVFEVELIEIAGAPTPSE